MDGLLKVALAGTSRLGGELPPPTMPTDELVASSDDRSAERRVLLLAGMHAIYRRAGTTPRAGAALPTAALADPLPACSPDAARLLAGLLAGNQAELLPEALERLRLAGWRVPHALLPTALEVGTRKSELRPALLATIGERGRWLAGQHQPWRWALVRPFATHSALPDDAEALWEAGSPAQRLAILRQVRAHDPTQGRAWLATAWQGEKADFRAETIKVLEVGLTPDDEPFLEAALGDRSQTVRAEATKLLARLPESAFVGRMRERADMMLDYVTHRQSGIRSFVKFVAGDKTEGQLIVTPPESVDKVWQRDGIAAIPAQAVGERSWWLTTVLSSIPPTHWSSRFGASPAELIAAAEKNDWGQAVLEGWANAAGVHGDDEWAILTWKWWCHHRTDHVYYHQAFLVLRWPLIRRLSRSQADALALETVPKNTRSDDPRWLVALEAMQSFPMPWPSEVGDRFLDGLHDRALQGFQFNYPYDPWLKTMTLAVESFPRECIPRFMEELAQLPFDGQGWERRIWREYRENYIETLRMRLRLEQEIPL